MFAFNRDLNVVLARGVRRMFAIALEQYRRALDERSVLDFSDVLAARGRAAAADGRVLAEPLPARVALPPRARRRVPGHEPRAVGAGVAAGPGLGRRARRSPTNPVDLHRRRSQAVDLPVPRRGGRACCERGRRVIDGAAAGRPRPPIDRAQLPRRARAAALRQRRVHRDVAAGTARAERRSPTRARSLSRSTTLPDRDAADARTPALGARRRGRRPEACAAAVADEIARILRERHRPRQDDRRRRGRRAPATSASCSARASSHREFERALERCAAFRRTSTRDSASSTPTKSRTSSR